ncbi:MAG: hypothetical protein EOS58_11200 [Mesorhizobium sp.]|uniref:hypothetical protein n=1 Tax=unclassified Mesorhizobium TaxID=325217 RepID=UPI000F7511B1|nr:MULTISPECIES: hypothetical protein [unclassified Mesorhizobium]RVD73671.1 hypothetical protein EN751_03685 [Mesorhizobium sp. M4A.F.Ca.ET.029.04.2.1]AZO49299.1 hypothetical protein EJ073_16940 [Mesorhizobium sp. M4B.F.Ca.ET.058.02.1.1]RUX42966.1 hypothetical protein EOA33_30515 [Mesorhizobium sp. M4A.F.Ca.ET.050.02.1.1]RVC42314.1 hypothetical protein EN781_22765 [Mesorhizobium sp. M4A.F.Ca.ET.090.04.2.1]RVC80296.1 hypothetical protein EN745_13365 [Mesorhizobium sp. M4A.F.Ca.ET.022.05.2.1]
MTSKEAHNKLLELCSRQSNELNDYLIEIQSQVTSAEFSSLRLMVGLILGNGFMPAFEEIGQKFPELKSGWMR